MDKSLNFKLRTLNLHTAITAALEAGKVILEIYERNDFEVQLKEDNSPLTKADIAAHNTIMSYLTATNIPVLSEEGRSIPYSERKDWKQLWIVDPIDGTKEFIKRNGEFTVNIALVENQKPILGVIFVPVSGELFFSTSCPSSSRATSNSNSNSNSISTSNSTSFPSGRRATPSPGAYKVKVNLSNYSVETLLTEAIKLPVTREDNTFTVLASRSHQSEKTREYIEEMRKKEGNIQVITKGSSLKYCMLAEGLAECYPKFGPTMEWDTAAGQAICEQAGVEVIDWDTKETLRYNREELMNGWFIAQ